MYINYSVCPLQTVHRDTNKPEWLILMYVPPNVASSSLRQNTSRSQKIKGKNNICITPIIALLINSIKNK